MMKKTGLKLLAWSLSFLMLSAAFTACDTHPDDPHAQTDPVTSGLEEVPGDLTDPSRIELFRNGACVYGKIIRADGAGDEEIEIAQRLVRMMREKTANPPVLDTDFRYDPDALEIVVATSSEKYPEIAELQQDMRYSDYAIVKRGNKLIVTAPSVEALSDAVNKLIKSVVGGMGEGTTDFSVPEVVYRARYTFDQITVAGVDLKEFTVVYAKDADPTLRIAAEEWQKVIGETYGYRLAVTDDSAPAGAHEILLGKTNRTATAEQPQARMTYEIGVQNGNLTVQAGGLYSLRKSADSFFGELKTKGEKYVALEESFSAGGTLMKVAAPARAEGSDLRIMSYNILAEFPSWNGENREYYIAPRAEILVENLYHYRPDVVTAPELTENWALTLHDQLGEDYALICDRFSDRSANFSALIYNTKTLELISYDVVRYSEGDNLRCRNMGISVFRIRATGKEFCAVSTHWNLGNQQIDAQPDELLAKFEELSQGGKRPVFAGGDFNSTEIQSSYQRFMSSGKVQNLQKTAKQLLNQISSAKYSLGMPAASALFTIDFLFATKEVQSLQFMTLTDNGTDDLSDHNGIMADVSW